MENSTTSSTVEPDIAFFQLAVYTLGIFLAYSLMHVPLGFFEGIAVFVVMTVLLYFHAMMQSLRSFFPALFLGALGGAL